MKFSPFQLFASVIFLAFSSLTWATPSSEGEWVIGGHTSVKSPLGVSHLDLVIQDTYSISVADQTFSNALGTLNGALNETKPGKFKATIQPSAEYLTEMQDLLLSQLQPKLQQFNATLTGFTPGPIIVEGKVNKYDYGMTGKAVMRVKVELQRDKQSMTVNVQVITDFVGVRAPEAP